MTILLSPEFLTVLSAKVTGALSAFSAVKSESDVPAFLNDSDSLVCLTSSATSMSEAWVSCGAWVVGLE